MRGVTHLAVGALLGVITGSDDIIVVMVGSIAPDIDHRNSIMGRFIPLWLITKHRGILHTIEAAIFAALIHPGLGLGYLSHLVLDNSLKFSKPTLKLIRSIRRL